MRLLTRGLFAGLLTAFVVVGCECPEPPNGEGEGEGDGAEGEGEGEGEGDGPLGPPTEPIRDPDPDDPNNAVLDSDCDGLSDLEEFTVVYAGNLRTNAADYDTDDDGIADGIEAGRDQAIDAECEPAGGTWLDADPTTTTSPVVVDSDGDCINDGLEDTNLNGAIDAGETNPSNPDSDSDGIPDQIEDLNCNGLFDVGTDETNAASADTDIDGINDGVEDANHNGIRDNGELDPRSPDSDGDGIPDGVDPNPFVLDPDGDSDGLPDSLDPTPNDADTDDDGLCDGPGNAVGICIAGEDLNLNGALDANETDPARPDTDCDGLSDRAERDGGSNPRVRDTDGDLLTDGVEAGITGPVPGSGCANVPVDADPASTTSPLDADSDDDGINDGTEDRDLNGALAPPNPGVGALQETNPNDADTDNDGICDGPVAAAGCTAGEDLNRNGIVDAGESDPRVPDVDTDGDGIPDDAEDANGNGTVDPGETDPNLADTDGDGIDDGDELAFGTDATLIDTDCDGFNDGDEQGAGTNALESDSDGDGVADGVEAGGVCGVQDTDPVCAGLCVPDEDPATTSDPLDPDTDGDQVPDGAEDANQNGAVDPGELDPFVPDASPTEQAACGLANLRQITLVERADQTADLILAVPTTFPAGRITTLSAGGNVIGAMVFDPAGQVAGVAMKLDVAGGDPSAKLDTIRGVLDAVGAVTAFNSQTFASWDSPGGNNAVIGRIGWTDDANGTVAASLNRVVTTLAPGATGVLDVGGSTAVGEYRMQVEVLERSVDTTLVVIALANAANANAVENVGFAVDDMANGTAVAQFGDDTGVQCDRFTVEPLSRVDFLLIIDNSGSMDNEQTATANAATQMAAQLGATTVDFRIAAVTTDIDEIPNDLATWQACELGNGGACNQTGDAAKVYCPFTTSGATLQACVDQMNIAGSGEENGFRPFACLLGRNVAGTGINQNLTEPGELGGAADGESCGRDGNRAPYPANVTYAAPPGPFALLPRAANDARKIRTGAQLAVIFITDANEQSDGLYNATNTAETTSTHSIPAWLPVFTNFDGAGDPVLSRAFVGGLTCPVGTNCTDDNGNYMNSRYATLIAGLGGIEAALPDNNDPQNAQKIADAIEAILAASVAQSSPYVLAKPPISSTIKIAVDFQTVDATTTCNRADMPRSRVHGFDYDGTTNSVTFFGDCRPLLDNSQVGRPFSISYRFWIEDSPNPDGNNDPCGDCPPPFVCVNQQCLCPSDCGVAGGLSPGQTCDAATCTPVCLPDCGGCPGGAVCDVGSSDCSCVCPADCNTGGTLPPGFVCDPATCLAVCAPDGCDPAERPGAQYVCGSSCEWECPDDCGDPAIGATETCNALTCTVECSPDCNASCGGFSTCNSDPAVCACECVESATCAPGFAFNNDPAVCGCACTAEALACPATHAPNVDECRCDCQPNCNNACAGGPCNQGLCECVEIGG